jgi:hypothetical protein
VQHGELMSEQSDVFPDGRHLLVEVKAGEPPK